MLDKGPRKYAQYLAGYISDPSTIRARVADYFGRDLAPTVAFCRKLRDKVEAVDRRKLAAAERRATPWEHLHFRCGHPRTEENTVIRTEGYGTCRTCRRAADARGHEKRKAKRKGAKP